jgi:hypothetical protein
LIKEKIAGEQAEKDLKEREVDRGRERRERAPKTKKKKRKVYRPFAFNYARRQA